MQMSAVGCVAEISGEKQSDSSVERKKMNLQFTNYDTPDVNCVCMFQVKLSE